MLRTLRPKDLLSRNWGRGLLHNPQLSRGDYTISLPILGTEAVTPDYPSERGAEVETDGQTFWRPGHLDRGCRMLQCRRRKWTPNSSKNRSQNCHSQVERPGKSELPTGSGTGPAGSCTANEPRAGHRPQVGRGSTAFRFPDGRPELLTTQRSIRGSPCRS